MSRLPLIPPYNPEISEERHYNQFIRMLPTVPLVHEGLNAAVHLAWMYNKEYNPKIAKETTCLSYSDQIIGCFWWDGWFPNRVKWHEIHVDVKDRMRGSQIGTRRDFEI